MSVESIYGFTLDDGLLEKLLALNLELAAKEKRGKPIKCSDQSLKKHR